MSNLHTCTSTTRPAEPSQGDMLFETDSNQLILYYGNDWLIFGSSAEAASTVPTIDINIGSIDEMQQYFNVRYLGDWGITTSSTSGLANPTPLRIKSNDKIFSYKTPDHDLSLEYFNKQLTLGEVKVGISSDPQIKNVQFNDANSVALGIVGTDIITTTEPLTARGSMLIGHGTVTDIPSIESSSNIVMQSDTSEVTFDTTYTPGTIIKSTLEDSSIHIGFAGDPNYGPSKDINNGMLIVPEDFHDREGKKSFVAKTYRDTSNLPVSAGPFAYTHGGSFNSTLEGIQSNIVATAWFKLSATDPIIEQGTKRFIFGLVSHSVVQAISASDGSGWYMDLETFNTTDVPQTSNTKLEEDVWYNVTLSVTGDNVPQAAGRDIRLYLDGNLIHTTTTTRTMYIRNIGNNGANANLTTGQRVLNGNWTGFAAWDQPLTENQIQLISNNTDLDKISVPEPNNWIHPINDPMRLIGAYDSKISQTADIYFNDNIMCFITFH